jgi:hypothetical protein
MIMEKSYVMEFLAENSDIADGIHRIFISAISKTGSVSLML